MNPIKLMKSYLYLIIAVIVLLAIAVGLHFKNNSGSLRGGEKEFSVKNMDAIDKIIIRSDTSSILLEKEKEYWRLNNSLRAKKDMVKLILTALPRLEAISPLPRNYQAVATKKLQNAGTNVEVYADERLVRAFYIDYDTTEVKGVIILNQKAKMPFLVKLKGFPEGDFTWIFNPELSFWKDNTMFSYTPDDITSVSIKYPDKKHHSFKIIFHPQNSPELFNPETGNKMNNVNFKMMNDYRYFFSDLKYYPVDPPDTIVLTGDLVMAEVTLQDKAGKITTIKLYKKPLAPIDNNNNPAGYDLNLCYGTINNEKGVVLVKYLDIDPILRELDDFLKK